MDKGDPKVKLGLSRSDMASLAGLALALALYYFAGNVWLSLLGALAFLLLAVRRLDLALVFVILSSPFYLYPKKFGGLAFSLTEFCVLSCAAAALVRGAVDWRQLGLTRGWLAIVRFLTGRAKAPVLLFLVASTASLFASEFLKFSLREYRTVVAEPALFFFLMAAYAPERRQVWLLMDAFLFLSAGVAAFGIVHYYFVGMVEAADGVRRVLAVFHSPNALALFLGRSAPMFAALALFYPAEGGGNKRRMAYALGGLVVAVCLFITYSRGAWFGVAAGLVFIVALRGRAYALAGAGVAAVASIVLLPVVGIERLASRETSIGRLYLWQSAVAMARDHPVLGVGLDNFLYQYPRYMLKEAWAEPNVSHPHNIILDYWTRVGALGLAALLWLQVQFWQSGLSLYRKSDPKTKVLAMALMASMIDFLAHGLLDNSFFLIDLAVIFWLTYGAMEALKEDTT